MRLDLTVEITGHTGDVVDFVADITFPDVRKRCAVNSDAGSVMIIPRERVSTGQCLARLYVQIKDEILVESSDPGNSVVREKNRNRRAAITLDFILA
ncbi:uncharacterized protein EAF02_011310 [Botrytis sinoallii]|uniref:uncharacterized protein n=1 Tax=Botrytis sinoallii TaxID=1463999 RepID=UPI00190110A9|nr:uncharacterized protein EAF02_011310 [Botrytis sinoallii]KAF7857077.1 hypothetical protein EAF02_011310 [Botrytis sinoallii]